MCSITVDRTGFPLVHVEQLALDVHLLPVTKVQCEAFLAEPNGFGDRWYFEVLQTNPRRSWRNLAEGLPTEALLTGIHPDEARAFADWLGSGFRLPRVAEWQNLFRLWREQQLDLNVLKGGLEARMERSASALIEGRTGHSLSELSYLSGGVLEWVWSKRGWQLLGQPAESLCPNLFDWRVPVRPTDRNRRCGLFGFRLVRSA